MKNFVIVTGGAGFVGSNLIEYLLKKTKKNIISIDNYSTGIRRNHIKNKRVKYLRGNTSKINTILKKYKKKYMQFFILVNLQEYIKVLKMLMNVLSQTQLVVKLYLSFV